MVHVGLIFLKQFQNQWKGNEIRSKTNKNTKDLFNKLLKNNKSLANYLFGGNRIGNLFGDINVVPEFESNFNPTFFKLVKPYSESQPRVVEQTRKANIILKTDAPGTDFIANLIALRDNLTTAADDSSPSKAAALSAIKDTVIGNLDKSELNFIDHFSSIGASLSRLETSETITSQQISAIVPLVSNEIDVDLADTLVRLNEIQNSYTAALQSGSIILGSSLLDYLK